MIAGDRSRDAGGLVRSHTTCLPTGTLTEITAEFSAESGDSAHLLFADLIECFAVDAKLRGGSGLETFHADLDTAHFAVAVIAGVDALDGLVDFLDELALAVA